MSEEEKEQKSAGPWKRWFPPINDESETAKKLARQGNIGIGAYAFMTIAGTAFAYFLETGPSSGQPLDNAAITDQILGTLIILPIIAIAVWRVWIGRAFVTTTLFLLLFVAEIIFKILSGTTNVGWMIAYAAILGTFINGIRGSWWNWRFRNKQKKAVTVQQE